MRSVPPNPDRDAWLARMRELARQQRDELLAVPQFPVYGLAAPTLRPYALADFRHDGPDWRRVCLWYGDRSALAGPFVSVTTTSPSEHVRRRHADKVLHAALAAERLRVAEDSGVELPDTPGPAAMFDVRLRLDFEPLRARLCVSGDLWATRVSVSRLDVVSVGRGVRPDDVRLVLVEDLVPYWYGRRDILGLPPDN